MEVSTISQISSLIITKASKLVYVNCRWLSAFLNLQPQYDITATMLHIFLETVGFALQKVYGKMFQKLMAFVCTVYMPMLQNIDSGGPVTRLESFLLNYRKTGVFSPPHGMMPANFW